MVVKLTTLIKIPGPCQGTRPLLSMHLSYNYVEGAGDKIKCTHAIQVSVSTLKQVDGNICQDLIDIVTGKHTVGAE